MEERDPHLGNYNESIDWRSAFKMQPTTLTPGKQLKKVMTIQMDISGYNQLKIIGGTNGTWMLREFYNNTDPDYRLYYISKKGEVKIVGKDCSVKVGRGKYIFSDEDGDIFLIDTNNDNIIDTGLNKIRDGIKDILNNTYITDYGEFAYVKNGILNIPDRNLSVKIKDNIESIGLNYYTTVRYTSYNLYDDTDVVPNTMVYEDILVPKQNRIIGINHSFYYVKGIHDILEKVYSTNDNSLIGILTISSTLLKINRNWNDKMINFEYTQVITYQKIKSESGSKYILEVYESRL